MAQIVEYDTIQCSIAEEENFQERLCRKCRSPMEDFNFRTNICKECSPNKLEENRKKRKNDLDSELDQLCNEFRKKEKVGNEVESMEEL